MKPVVAIYAIRCALTNAVLYVGATNSPHTRISGHRKTFKGREITLQVLRWCDEKEAGRIELQVIAAYRRNGVMLANSESTKAREWSPASLLSNRPDDRHDAAELRAELQRTGLTPKQAARVIGCGQRIIYDWLSGDRSPKPYAAEGALARLRRVKKGAK